MWGTGKDTAALLGLGSSTCYKVELTSPGWDPGGTSANQKRRADSTSEKTHTIMKLKIEPHKGGLVKNRKTKA